MTVRSQLNSVAQVATTPDAEAPKADNSKAKIWLAMAAIAVATIVAYSPVLFDFFAGDDFVHLTWLRYAVTQPELIWKNFYSSWLDGTTTKFYRPLISIFMVTDYMVWKTNGLGFHITNLVFHIASAFLLFGVVRQAEMQLAGRKTTGTALLAAAVFALYPLHPEAVSWITGRVDTIVTTFCLASIFAYLQWRSAGKPLMLAVSLVTFVLGLLSKEMAITVPCVLFGFEFLRPGGGFKKFFCTAPFWVTLAAYFVVRRIALGTFVGGYDDSLLFIANLKEFAFGWAHALRMFIIPINRELLGARDPLTKLWEIYTVLAAGLLVVRLAKDKQCHRPLLFALGWLVLSLLPVYKLFAIADDLQGSRLAYLATVPLSVFIAYALTTPRLPSMLRAALPVSFCVLAAVLLWINNQPWREAGLQANALRASLQNIYSNTKGDPQTLLIGMPDHHHGAYISRNALWGMTKYPQLTGDVWNCLMLNEFEPVHPFGYLKPSLFAAKDSVKIYRWLPQDKQFAAVTLTADEKPAQFRLLGPLPNPPSGTKNRTTELIATDDPCWNIDFVQVDLELENAGAGATGADLMYANDIAPEFYLGRRTHCDLTPGQKEQRLLFALRSLPQWSFGAKGAQLALLLPPGSKATIKSITSIPAASVMPSLDFENSGYMGTKGYLHLGSDKPQNKFTVDASSVPGAVSSEIEITRANLLFEEQNAKKYSAFAREHTRADLKQTVVLDKKDFPAQGIYELRAWAKDKDGKIIGVASDHIVIAVDP